MKFSKYFISIFFLLLVSGGVYFFIKTEPTPDSIPSKLQENSLGSSYSEEITETEVNLEVKEAEISYTEDIENEGSLEQGEIPPDTEPIKETQVTREVTETSLQESILVDESSSISALPDRPYLVIALAGGLVISFFMILFLFFSLIKLYRWRINIKDSNKSIILPEVHYEKLERLEAGFNALAELVQEVGKLSQITDRESKERIEEILSSFLGLRDSISNKEAEISRLKSGYDNEIKKSFTSGLLSLRDRIEHYFTDTASSEDLSKACEGMLTILDNILEEENILSFEYEPGISIRDIEDFEIYEKVATSNKEKIGLVIKTIKKGYYLKGLDETKVVIRNALLECYVEE